MPASIVNLAPECRAPADKLQYGAVDWVAIHSASHAATSCGPAAVVAASPSPAFQHFLCHAQVSFSAVNAAANTITVKDDTTVIWQVEVPATVVVNPIDLNFETRPLRATPGKALTVNCGDAGSGVTCTIVASGFTLNQGTQTSV